METSTDPSSPTTPGKTEPHAVDQARLDASRLIVRTMSKVITTHRRIQELHREQYEARMILAAYRITHPGVFEDALEHLDEQERKVVDW